MINLNILLLIEDNDSKTDINNLLNFWFETARVVSGTD